MNNLISLVVILITSIVFSQSIEKNTSMTFTSSPGSWDDGFSLGFGAEHQKEFIYVGAELYASPWLNATGTRELGYYHLVGRFGLNLFVGDADRGSLRLFSGVRGGGIARTGDFGIGLLGLECGFDITFGNSGVFIRVMPTSEMKGDSKLWSRKSHHTVNSLIGGIGIKF